MTQAEAIPPVAHKRYRRLALLEMPDEIKLGLNLAFYRSFGIPAIAELLAATGEITGRTLKRADDTGLIMYLLIYYGFEHPQGKAVLARLNRMHRRHSIANSDYLYVLACVAIIPTRWVAAHGPRRLTAEEEAATYGFYRELGERMGVHGIPPSFDELERFMDDFEHRHMCYSAAAQQLMAASSRLLTERFPGWLRPLTRQWPAAMLDARLREAVGLPSPSRFAELSLGIVLRLRARRSKLRRSAFDPQARVRSYPDGYTIEDLGPSADCPSTDR
jgi:ER-bound oxygenase mpaB/B'/Rubber oxygenase, catalytic domain